MHGPIRRIASGILGLGLWLGLPAFGQPAPVLRSSSPQAPLTLTDPVALTATGGLVAPPPTHEELQRMAPEEREARLKLQRDRKVLPLKNALTPAEREKRRQEIRQRLEKRLEALRKRKKERPLSAEEEKQLRRLEEVSRSFQFPKKNKGDGSMIPTLETK